MFIIYNFTELKKIVKEKVKEKRFIHILGVVQMAEKLAKIYGADTEKVKIAALLHDICKEMNIDEMRKIFLENYKDEFPREDIDNSQILHGPVAAYWIRKNLNINDEEILNAVKYHTVGNKDMGLIEKIVYIADAIELGRDYPSVQEIREKTFQNLNEGIILEIEKKGKFLESMGKKSHINTIQMKKELLKELEKKDEV